MPAHKIYKPSFSRHDPRGTLHEVLNEGTWQSIITGVMEDGATMGNHYHKETTVFFFILDGTATVITENVETGERDKFRFGNMEGVMLLPNESHRLTFDRRTRYLLLKSLPYNPDEPDTYEHPLDND